MSHFDPSKFYYDALIPQSPTFCGRHIPFQWEQDPEAIVEVDSRRPKPYTCLSCFGQITNTQGDAFQKVAKEPKNKKAKREEDPAFQIAFKAAKNLSKKDRLELVNAILDLE